MSTQIRSLTLAVLALLIGTPVFASSHREAPFITEMPKVDGTDLYMFNSYEPGRQGFVTIAANYLPLQAPYGGPNYFALDPDIVWDVATRHVPALCIEALALRARLEPEGGGET